MSQGETLVECPVCGFDYAHPQRVNVYPLHGTQEVIIDREGFDIQPSTAASSQRGVSIVLRFMGECGHTWETQYRFHKGQTFLTQQVVATVPEGEEPPPIDTIWRS